MIDHACCNSGSGGGGGPNDESRLLEVLSNIDRKLGVICRLLEDGSLRRVLVQKVDDRTTGCIGDKSPQVL